MMKLCCVNFSRFWLTLVVTEKGPLKIVFVVVVTSLLGGMQSIVMSICLLSVYSHISETLKRNFIKFFLCRLLVAVVQSSSDTAAICCFFPVFWMTSCLLLLKHVV